jgi:dihydropyrimidinase
VAASLLVRGGTVVSATGRARADVLVRDGRIAEAGAVGAARGADVLDATGCLVLPGGVDAHTHVLGAIEADTRSAALGGTTTVLAFVDAQPGERPADAARRAREEQVPRAVCDVGLHGVIWEPAGYRPGDVEDLAAAGVTSLKLWLAYHELGIQADDAQAYGVLREAAASGVLVSAHCENGLVVEAMTRELVEAGARDLAFHAASRPDVLEAEAVRRFLLLARLAGAHAYVVHVSSAAALAEIDAARAGGQGVLAEVCPHHLLETAERYRGPDAIRFAMTPPLRSDADRRALWRALADGRLDVYASDHSHVPLGAKAAAAGFAELEYGVPGVGARLALGWTAGVEAGRLSPERFVAASCEAPARAFGLYPRKGTLTPGADADLVVWDPAARWVVQDGGLGDGLDYSPYAGRELIGRARDVLVGGERVVEDGAFRGREAPGRFLARPRQAPGRGHVDAVLGREAGPQARGA